MNSETVQVGRQLDEISALVESATGVEELRPLYYRVTAIARTHAGDETAVSCSAHVLARIVERGNELCRASVVPVKNWEDEKPCPEPLVPSPGEGTPAPDVLALIPAEPVQPEIYHPTVVLGVDRRSARNNGQPGRVRKLAPNWLIVLAGTLMGVSTVVGLIKIFVPKEAPANAVAAASTALTPAGTPLPSLYVNSDLEGGHVLIDGKLAGPLHNGEFRLRDLPRGDYQISVVSGVHQADFAFKTGNGGLPRFSLAPVSPTMFALVYATAGGEARTISSAPGGKLSIDDAPGVLLPPQGGQDSAAAAGDHQIDYTDSKGTRRFQITLDSTPSIHILLQANNNSGGLLVQTGENETEIVLNGRALPSKSLDGRLKISGLAPGEYFVLARKPGYSQSPEKSVIVRRGQDSRVVLPLRARAGIQ